jgi:hypothetical protein
MSDIKTDMGMRLCSMASYSLVQGVQVVLINEQCSYVTYARNKLVIGALRHHVDYLMWLDTDMIVPDDAMIRLLKHDKDIVGASYARRSPPFDMLGKIPKGTDLAAGGLVEADFLPSGCILVKADVYKKMKWPWYYETYHRDVADGRDLCDSFFDHLEDSFNAKVPLNLRDLMLATGLDDWIEQNVPVNGMTDENPYINEDFCFIHKAKRLGYEAWLDLDMTYEIGHIGTQIIACARPDGKTVSDDDIRLVADEMRAT